MFSTVPIYALYTGSYALCSLKRNTFISIFKDLLSQPVPILPIALNTHFSPLTRWWCSSGKEPDFQPLCCLLQALDAHTFWSCSLSLGRPHQSSPHNSSMLLKAFPKGDNMYWPVLYVPARGREAGLDDLLKVPSNTSTDLPCALSSACVYLSLRVTLWHEQFLHHILTAFSY